MPPYNMSASLYFRQICAVCYTRMDVCIVKKKMSCGIGRKENIIKFQPRDIK